MRVTLFLLGMCSLLNLYSTQPVLSQLAQWSGQSPEHSAWTISATTFGVALCAPFAGAISDVFGRKKLMILALSALTISTLCCIFAPNFWVLLTLRLFQGMATPFVFTVAVAYIAEECVERARVNSIYVAGTAFGGFAGRLLSGLITDATGSWRLSFLANASLILMTLVVTIAFLPIERNFSPAISVRASVSGLSQHMKDPAILASCFIAAALLFQQVSTFTFGSLHLMTPPFSLSATAIGFVFVVFLLPTALTPLSGKLISTKGRYATFAVVTVLTLGGLSLSLIPLTTAVVAGLACSCVAVFMGQSCGTGFVGAHAVRNTSAAVGLYTFSYYFGGTLGAILPQAAYAQWGWLSTALIVGTLSVMSLGLARAFWRI